MSKDSSDGLADLLTAVFADAINLEIVASGVEVVFVPDLFFQLAYFRREELDRSAALRTDHVVMAAAVELVFIARHAVRERDGAGQPAFRQQFERAVYGSKADLGIFLSHQPKKLVG